MIIRGTTPLLVFTINSELDLTAIADCWVTIRVNPKNASKKEKTYYKDDLTIDPLERTVELRLSQEDTLFFTASPCQVQMRIKMNNGLCYASTIIEEAVEKVLNSEVM